MRRAVFIDRDGVLARAVIRGGRAGSARTLAEFQIDLEAGSAVQRLREAGFVIVAITNQPDVARGFLTAEAIDQQNALLQGTLSLDAVYVCPHDNAERCVCRKPRPGLLLEAAEDLDLNLTESWMIGDRWVDVAAADSAGVTPVLLQRPWSWDETSAGVAPDEFRRVASAESLASCVDIILAKPGVEIAT